MKIKRVSEITIKMTPDELDDIVNEIESVTVNYHPDRTPYAFPVDLDNLRKALEEVAGPED